MTKEIKLHDQLVLNKYYNHKELGLVQLVELCNICVMTNNNKYILVLLCDLSEIN